MLEEVEEIRGEISSRSGRGELRGEIRGGGDKGRGGGEQRGNVP